MVAAAIVGAAVVGGVATSVAGSSAANATNAAAGTAAGAQYAALDQQKQLAQPYTDLGQAAIPQYEQLLGIGPNANAGTISQALQNTPGYQFTQQQGEQGILNAASAAGGLSGNTLTALDKYNTGLADQTYQSAVGNSLNAVELGQGAAAGVAANVGTAASNIGSIATNQGNNLANIDIGEAAGISKALGSGANNYATYSALQSA